MGMGPMGVNKVPLASSGHRVGMGDWETHWQWTGLAAQCSIRFSWQRWLHSLACGEDLTRSRPHGSQGAAWQAGASLSRPPVQPKKGTTVMLLCWAGG
jgi:hypothetical protein